MNSIEFHGKKPATMLAERLNLGPAQLDADAAQQNQPFPEQLQLLISKMLNSSRVNIATLAANQFGSLVLQVSLYRLLVLPHCIGVHHARRLKSN